jgi:hypothetical protein
MYEPTEKEKQLQEYFSTPIAAPSYLVPHTLRKIREGHHIGVLIGAVALNLIIVLILTVFLLAGPLLLFWKIVILMMFFLFQAIAVAILLYNVFGSTLEPSAY